MGECELMDIGWDESSQLTYSVDRSIEEESSEQMEMTSSSKASRSSLVSAEEACEVEFEEEVDAVLSEVGGAAEELGVAVESVEVVEGTAVDEDVRKILFSSCSASFSFLTFSYSGSSVSTSNLHIGH